MKFEIWSEGYRATGNSGVATFLGYGEGIDFKCACDDLAKSDLKFKQYYDPLKLTYWGCRLFSNSQDARKFFG